MIIPSMLQQGYDTPLDVHKPGLVKPVKGDGNCLFSSFSYVISCSEEHHLEIRRWVREYINLFTEKIDQFSGKQNYVSASKMAKPGVRGTDIEIMTVASILDTNVHTYIHKAWMQPALAQIVKVGPRYPFTHQKQVLARDISLSQWVSL